MLPPTEQENAFACLNVADNLLRQLDRLGFHTPTPIQEESIPLAMAGRDVVGIAQTGTGKTLAFGLPMLQRLWDNDGIGLILAPTRELALQIEEELKKVAGGLGLKTAVLIGGAPMNRQIGDLRRRPNVIVASPGRLVDHLNQGTATLKGVTMVVLDEADRMFDMGFAPIVHKILEQVPAKRQTMLFSATMAPEVADLTRRYLTDPARVEIAPQGTASELVEQELHVVEKDAKGDLLNDLLEANPGTILVFSRTRHGARKVARSVRAMGHSAAELHSDRTLAQRKQALQGFKTGEYRVLVATDIAARGIDVKEISLVINYDLPDQIEDYIHRIGRTGRAGSTGRAVTFALPEQHRDVRQIEKILGRELPVMTGKLPPAPSRGQNSPRQGQPQRANAPRQGGRPAAPRNGGRPDQRPPRPEWQNRTERPTSQDRPARQNWQPRDDKPRFDGPKPDFKRNDARPADRPNYGKPKPDFKRTDDRPYQKPESREGRPVENREDRPRWKKDPSGRPINPRTGDARQEPARPSAPRPPFKASSQSKPKFTKANGTPRKFQPKPFSAKKKPTR